MLHLKLHAQCSPTYTSTYEVATHQNRFGSESQHFEHVVTIADTPIGQHEDSLAHGFHDTRQNFCSTWS